MLVHQRMIETECLFDKLTFWQWQILNEAIKKNATSICALLPKNRDMTEASDRDVGKHPVTRNEWERMQLTVHNKMEHALQTLKMGISEL